VGDPRRLATVLQNLLVNAHIHGGGHSVTVHCEVGEDDEFLSIHVRDNGPGIPQDAQPVIFEPGVRASNRPGAGLGLHISRELMREQGGDIMLHDVRAGAAFIVRIPLVRAERLR
jgi:signal transduction histidine kinase